MRTELPKFRRCCCCLPLRYGLIAAGYIKLGFTFLTLLYLLYILVLFTMVHIWIGILLPHIILTVLAILLLILDICMTIVFLVGGHTKTVKLLQVFYVYSMVALGILTLLFAVSIGFELHLMRQDTSGKISYPLLVHSKIACLITFFGVGMYIILLVRSEIKKLRNENQSFRFVNVANEAQCAIENGIPEYVSEGNDLKKGTDDAKHKTNDHDGVIIDQKGTNGQFDDIIDQSKTDRRNFNYTKL